MARTSPFGPIVLGLAVAACARAPAPIRAVAGCYAVSLSPWDMHPSTYDHPRSPPDTVRLGTVEVVENGAVKGFEVQPNIFASPLHREIAPTWQRRGDS